MEFTSPAGAYAFGDTEVAARRLAVLDQVFGPASRDLLASVTTSPPALAYDLGCGPGHTTAMVAQATGAAATIGLDTSAAHIERARAHAAGQVGFAVQDVLALPFPAGPADLIYCRLLLAHLPDPAGAVRSWSGQLTPDGIVVLDEIEWIDVSEPVLRNHLRLAEGLVAASGARMCAGPLLAGLGDEPGLRQVRTRITEVPVATALAATMFSMNIAVWGDRPARLGLCDDAELRDLAAAMAALRESPATGEITWGMHQAAYARR
ncbi:MAG TPA: class I SAM-dependent methyltransferase [Streptosporangiaceae bacterium]|jgi:SAM-dependent methyltransferase|nr:class I SAM-dependent methyltransferase [Streptosporangiaceae bacterium]